MRLPSTHLGYNWLSGKSIWCRSRVQLDPGISPPTSLLFLVAYCLESRACICSTMQHIWRIAKQPNLSLFQAPPAVSSAALFLMIILPTGWVEEGGRRGKVELQHWSSNNNLLERCGFVANEKQPLFTPCCKQNCTTVGTLFHYHCQHKLNKNAGYCQGWNIYTVHSRKYTWVLNSPTSLIATIKAFY